jgi:hypothetical protein
LLLAHQKCGATGNNTAMIVEKEFRKLVHQLVKEEVAQIVLGHSEITVHVFDNAAKISLASTVYFGGNFIPKSVRRCMSQSLAFQKGHIKTFFNIDEENFRITLNYIGGLSHLNKRMFVDLLEEFSWLADEWRLYLDEHDKNDLVYVHVPKP